MDRNMNRPIVKAKVSILIAALVLVFCLAAAGAESIPQFHPYLGMVTITSESANLRAEPQSKAELLVKAEEGDRFTCSAIAENGWYELLLPDGRTAYVSAKVSSLKQDGSGEEVIRLDSSSDIAYQLKIILRKDTATREDLAGVTSLTLSGNGLYPGINDWAMLDLLPNLAELTIEKINMGSFAVTQPLASLRTLTLFCCENIPYQSISTFTGLTSLTVQAGELADLSLLSGMKNLEVLKLIVNPITDLSPLAGLTALQELAITGGQLADLSPLAGLENLTTLELSSGHITDCSRLAGLTGLTRLDLYDNDIADISPLQGLTNLATLLLSENQIADITPLSGLTNLTRLELSNNPIVDVAPLSGLTALTELGLYGLDLQNYDGVATLTNLRELSLEKTIPGGMAALDALFEAGCEIYLSPYTNYGSGDFDDVKVTLRTQGSGALFYYVDFQSALTAEQLGYAYIHAGDSVNVFLPPNQPCWIYYSSGKPSAWIDLEHAFGEDGDYYRMDTVFVPEAGYSYEITLYGVTDGNTSSSPIANPYP